MVTKLWSSGEEASQCILPKQSYLPWMCCQYHSFLSLWLVLLFGNGNNQTTASSFVLSEMLLSCKSCFVYVLAYLRCHAFVISELSFMLARTIFSIQKRRLLL